MTANGLKTHCPRGHEYDEANTYASSAGRICRRCRRERSAAARREAGIHERGTSPLCRKGLHPMEGDNLLLWKGKQRQCRTCLEHSKLARLYNLTPERYEQMHAEQGGLCAGCREEKPLVVDHDHVTGQPRGLLCHNCNLSLGHAQDSTEILKGLIYYLERS